MEIIQDNIPEMKDIALNTIQKHRPISRYIKTVRTKRKSHKLLRKQTQHLRKRLKTFYVSKKKKKKTTTDYNYFRLLGPVCQNYPALLV